MKTIDTSPVRCLFHGWLMRKGRKIKPLTRKGTKKAATLYTLSHTHTHTDWLGVNVSLWKRQTDLTDKKN